MANVYDLANQLEREIRALPEYQAVLEAKTAVEADQSAREVWQDFTETQNHMQNLIQSGQMPSAEEQEQLQDLMKRFEENPLLKTYLDAQQRLAVYIADLEKIIFSPLQDLS